MFYVCEDSDIKNYADDTPDTDTVISMLQPISVSFLLG